MKVGPRGPSCDISELYFYKTPQYFFGKLSMLLNMLLNVCIYQMIQNFHEKESITNKKKLDLCHFGL